MPNKMVELYEHTNRQFPQQTIVAFGLADAYGRNGRLPQAATQYRRILTKDPQHVAATNNLALTLQELSCANRSPQKWQKEPFRYRNKMGSLSQRAEIRYKR